MPSREKSTFYLFKEPLDLRFLNLGTLVQLEKDDLVVVDELEDPWMSYNSKQGLSFGGGLSNLLELKLEPSTSESISVFGTKGVKEEILEPQRFLNEVVLKSEGADWLRLRLAVSRKVRAYYRLTLQTPRVWLVTGLIAIENGETVTVFHRDSKHSGKASVPLPDPSGLSQTMQVMLQIHGAQDSSRTISRGSKVSGKKVWAAQFQRLKANYLKIEDGQVELDNQIKLSRIMSTTETRAEDELVDLTVESGDTDDGSNLEYAAEFDDKYWEAFEAELEEEERRDADSDSEASSGDSRES
ncbi:hypothetical protein LTR28_007846 [Elasticomyces elasticus]|nr:hypothetical protein LTR28_007846 [Elasticomyces elasticus]